MDRTWSNTFDGLDRRLDDLRTAAEHQQRLATLGTIAAIIAHELRNILTPVRTYAQMALAAPNDAELTRKAIQRAADCSERAGQIVDAILGFSKPVDQESDATLPLGRAAGADVESALAGALGCLARELSSDRIDLAKGIESGSTVCLRSTALQHVLLNLILNARTAMLPRGGRLTVSARRMTASDLESFTWNVDAPVPPRQWGGEAGWTVIAIEDTGRGMSAEQVASLFQPFANSPSGSGLGMAICKSLVEDAGGQIRVASSPGVGTRVEIALPSCSESEVPLRKSA